MPTFSLVDGFRFSPVAYRRACWHGQGLGVIVGSESPQRVFVFTVFFLFLLLVLCFLLRVSLCRLSGFGRGLAFRSALCW